MLSVCAYLPPLFSVLLGKGVWAGRGSGVINGVWLWLGLLIRELKEAKILASQQINKKNEKITIF